MTVKSQQEILSIVDQLRRELEGLYGPRLKGVYLFGSHARGDAREDSDIDIAVVLERLASTYEEREHCSELQALLSLEKDCVLVLLFMDAASFSRGEYAIHRAVAREGIAL